MIGKWFNSDFIFNYCYEIKKLGGRSNEKDNILFGWNNDGFVNRFLCWKKELRKKQKLNWKTIQWINQKRRSTKRKL